MKIEILKAVNGQWYFRIVAVNGKIICHSETYKQRQSAIKGAEAIIQGILNFGKTQKDIHCWMRKNETTYILDLQAKGIKQ